MPFTPSPMRLAPAAQCVPAELLDEFVFQSDTQALQTTSLVCARWRHLSQQRLFESVTLNPMHDHGIYRHDPGSLTHAPLGEYIKKLVLTDCRKANTIPVASLHPRLASFLRSLSRLEEMAVMHSGFSWSEFSEDTTYAILDVLGRSSFHTLIVSLAGVFPIPLFLLGPNIKTLVLTYVLAPTQRIMDPELAFGPSQTRLATLELARIPCIKEFARLVSPEGQASDVIQCLETVTLDYIEGFSDGMSHSEAAGTFLRHLGNSVKTVQLRVTQLRPEFAPSIPGADLQGLTGLEVLEITLYVQKSVAGDIMRAAKGYVLPIIRNLPYPRSLTWLKFSCQVFPKGPATLVANRDAILQFVRDFVDALIKGKYKRLKKMDFAIDLCALGVPSDTVLRRTENLSGFSLLSSGCRAVVNATVTESVPRIC